MVRTPVHNHLKVEERTAAQKGNHGCARPPAMFLGHWEEPGGAYKHLRGLSEYFFIQFNR